MTDDLYDIEAFRYGLMLILAAWEIDRNFNLVI